MADERPEVLTAEDVAAMREQHETGGVDGWHREILVSRADYARIVATLELLMAENARLTALSEHWAKQLAGIRYESTDPAACGFTSGVATTLRLVIDDIREALRTD